MAKVLCVLQGYANKTEANAICLDPIIKIWRDSGHYVDVLSLENENQISDGKVFVVPKKESLNNKLLRQIRKFFYMPLDNPSVVDSIEHAIERILHTNSYDVIIAVVNPVESANAVSRVKQKYHFPKTILYEIDPTSNRYKYPKGIVEKLWRKRSIIWELEMYKSFDTIVHMKSHNKHFQDEIYKQFSNKTIYLDIPSFSINILEKKMANKKIKMVYAGAFYPELRNPAAMIKLLINVSMKAPIYLDIYTGNSMRSEIQALIQGYEEVFCLHNYVSQEELMSAYMQADVLIDLGNKESDYLSSKILQYIGTAKPIIHFAQDNEDVAIDYVDRYSRGINVSLEEDSEVAIGKVIKFISNLNSLEEANEQELRSVYFENTPEYTAEKIMEIF